MWISVSASAGCGGGDQQSQDLRGGRGGARSCRCLSGSDSRSSRPCPNFHLGTPFGANRAERDSQPKVGRTAALAGAGKNLPKEAPHAGVFAEANGQPSGARYLPKRSQEGVRGGERSNSVSMAWRRAGARTPCKSDFALRGGVFSACSSRMASRPFPMAFDGLPPPFLQIRLHSEALILW